MVSCRTSNSRILGDGPGYGLYTRGPKLIVGDIEAEQGTIGEKHGRHGLSPRSS